MAKLFSRPKKLKLGRSKSSSPALRPLKTKVYTKDILGKAQDPSQFGTFGFGDTALHQTPSIMGMGRKK
jgi:hypothetical protein